MTQDSVVKIDAKDIVIGKPLPWPVYNKDKRLLLQEGASVASERQVEILLAQGLYRPMTIEEIKADQEPEPVEEKPVREKKSNPFYAKNVWADLLTDLFDQILNPKSASIQDDVLQVSDQIIAVTKEVPDALLSAIHLTRSFDYATHHPIHTAALSTMLMEKMEFEPERERALIAAAMTMNIGMLELQRELFVQQTPLTEAQKAGVQNHPNKSVEMLKKAGITNPIWLQAIEQHHEKVDGSGYPNHLSGDAICLEARILSIVDIYAAMVTPREYRQSVAGHDALKKIFMARGKAVDESLAALLIREVGLYPPGSYVKIANGDIAVVARRPIDAAHMAKNPMVYSIISPRGGMYDQPIKRDTNMDCYKILSTAQPETKEPIDTQMIWGMKFN